MRKTLYQIIRFDRDFHTTGLVCAEGDACYTTDGLSAYGTYTSFESFLKSNDSDNTVWLKEISMSDSSDANSWDATYSGAGFYYSCDYFKLYRHKCDFAGMYTIADSIISDKVGHVGENKVYMFGDQFTGSAIVTTSYPDACDWLDRRYRNDLDEERVKELVESIKGTLRGDHKSRTADVEAGNLLGIVHHTTQYTNSKEGFFRAFSEIREVFEKYRQRSSLRDEAAKCVLASEQMHKDKNCCDKYKASERDM